MLTGKQSQTCHWCVLVTFLGSLFAVFAIAELPVLGPLSAAEMERRLVDHEWLLGHLDDPDLVIVDTRDVELYNAGHIEGAVNLPVWDTFGSEPRDDLAAPISVIQKLFSSVGIDQETRVILYDNGDMVNAARVFWILETHGHRRVGIMSPGYLAWAEKRLPVSDQPVTPARRNFLSHVTPHRLATKFSTRLAISDPDTVIIDARTSEEYEGSTSRSARRGHIPGAMSIPADQNLDPDKTGLKSFDELKAMYSKIDKDKKVITYCNKGRESALTYFILRQLGYDVAAYDGAWHEWGNDSQLPIETGAPVDKQ